MQSCLDFKQGGTLSTKPKTTQLSDKSIDKEDSSKKQRVKYVPWVEKYRPATVDDVAHQDDVVAVLKKSLQGADLPNLLFYGPPGTGKTSTILAVSRDLFGPEMFRERVLELNASDERGISVVREKVKKFAQNTASSRRPDGKKCPPFKIIILDEADSMTSSAQAALRRTMEKQSRTTRFCLICNYISRIIEPLTSRCAKFRFKPLAADAIRNRLQYVCEKESVICTEEAVQALITTSDGDLRRAITFLQSVARLKGKGVQVEAADVLLVSGFIEPEVISSWYDTCCLGSYDKIESFIKGIIADGYPACQLLLQLHDTVVNSPDLTDKQKSAITEKLAVVDKRLLDGADESLQLTDVSVCLMNEICATRD